MEGELERKGGKKEMWKEQEMWGDGGDSEEATEAEKEENKGYNSSKGGKKTDDCCIEK